MSLDEIPKLIPVAIWNRATYSVRIRAIIEFLREHLDEPFVLRKMAQVACMEKTSLSRMFKRKTGVTLREFLHVYRISRAVELMQLSDSSVTQIAFEVGFNSVGTFERAFRKTLGVTPSAYRTEILRRRELLPPT